MGPNVLKALQKSFSERKQTEIDSNRAQTSSPLPSMTFSETLAEEYDKWFKTLHAGLMSPQTVGLDALRTSLRVYNLRGWGSAFTVYWTSVVWLPSGIYTGGLTINAAAQGALLQNEINNILSSEFTSSGSKTMEDFANRIANVLHSYTTKLQVQATLSAPPNTKVETVM